MHLHKNEIIQFIIRKHWLVFLGEAVLTFIAAILPVVVYVVLMRVAGESPILIEVIDQVPEALLSFVFSIWLLLAWIRLFTVWTALYLDSWRITNERIIDINQRGFFSRKVSSIKFDRIQDITVEVTGFVETILDIGEIQAQTAGGHIPFSLKSASRPYFYKEEIRNARDRYTKHHTHTHSGGV